MAELKLYFCILDENKTPKISVHRNLSTLIAEWESISSVNVVGLIHVGFVRPKFANSANLFKYKGNVLATVAAKWALPLEYNCSLSVIGELKASGISIPIHLILSGFGYEVREPGASYCIENKSVLKSTHTITSATLKILNGLKKPLNKEEIYAHIIEQELYSFGAKKPINVLSDELNRHCRSTEYRNSTLPPLFGKNSHNQFFSLDLSQGELSGWLLALNDEFPEIIEQLVSYGIYDEDSYVLERDKLSFDFREFVDILRFNILKQNIDTTNPTKLLNIIPQRILDSDLSSLRFSVRVLNVFGANQFQSLEEIKKYSIDDMMKWPNFGRKSITDFCVALLESAGRTTAQLSSLGATIEKVENIEGDLQEGILENDIDDYQFKLTSATPLIKHFRNALDKLKERERLVIEFRTGFGGQTKTLEETGKIIDVTRERVRQIQKKCIQNIINTEAWDDCISIKIGQLLIERESPLLLELLEIEDDWFSGFFGNYQHLATIIELFSENEIKVIKINGAHILTRIKQKAWDSLVSKSRKSLKDKARDGSWTRSDILLSFRSVLFDLGAAELSPLLWDEFSPEMQFQSDNDTAKFIAFGKTAETAVFAVLQQAEEPLHFTEIATRATSILGKTVEVRRAHGAAVSQGGKLFGRGMYGLKSLNPILNNMCKYIRVIVEKILMDGALMKQWHVTELLNKLVAQFPSLPSELNLYLLNIILEDSNKLIYLNKNIWARADSGQLPGDRIDMADAFTRILEEAGEPLKGVEIKKRLQQTRGVHDTLQLQPTERMIMVGPDTWGLTDRDIPGTVENNLVRLGILFDVLQNTQKGIHVTEVDAYLNSHNFNDDSPSAYTLFNLAQRDDRFYLGRSMFLGLSEWGDDTRRLNVSQAVREILLNMNKPLTIGEINSKVAEITGLEVDGTVTHILINEGAIFDSSNKMWKSNIDV